MDVDQARARLDLSQVGLIGAEVALDTSRLDLEKLVNAPISKSRIWGMISKLMCTDHGMVIGRCW